MTGAGLSVNCSSSTFTFDAVGYHELPNGTTVTDWDSVQEGAEVFSTQFGWHPDQPSNLSLDVIFKDTSPCKGQLAVRSCTLRTATVQYPVTISGNKSTISLDPNSDIFDDVIVSDIDYPFEDIAMQTRMGGYWFALTNRFAAATRMRFAGGISLPYILPSVLTSISGGL